MNSAWLFLLSIVLVGGSMCLNNKAIDKPLPFEATFKDGDYVKFYVNIDTHVKELFYSTFLSEKPKHSTADQVQIMPSSTESLKIKIELSLQKYHNNSHTFILWSGFHCKKCYCDSREVVKLYIDDDAHRDKPKITLYNNATFYLNTTECKAKPTLKIFSGADETEVTSVVSLDGNSRVNLRCPNRFPNTTINWINDVTKDVLNEETILETQLPSGTTLSCIEVYKYESGSDKFLLTFSRSAVVQLIENVPVIHGRSSTPQLTTIAARTETTTAKINTETPTTTLSNSNLNKEITHIRRNGGKKLLILVPTLLIVSILLGVGIFLAYKCYKKRTTKARQPRLNGDSVPGVEVETYACPQEVTYAQLEMNNTRRANLKINEVEPYAEVIGVLAPVNEAGDK